MPSLAKIALAALAAVGLTMLQSSRGCGYEPGTLKGEGEACTRSSECESGLACRGGVCRSREGTDAGSASVLDAGGARDGGAALDASALLDGGEALDGAALSDGGGESDAGLALDAGAPADGAAPDAAPSEAGPGDAG